LCHNVKSGNWSVEFDDAVDRFGVAVVGPVGGWCAMRRLARLLQQ